MKSDMDRLEKAAAGYGPEDMKALNKQLEKDFEDGEFEKPMTDRELEDLPTINWYVQDLDKGTPKQLVKSLATIEDHKREQKMYFMRKEMEENPDYDDTEYRHMLMDDMIASPEYANVVDELKWLKSHIRSSRELAELEAKGVKPEKQLKQEYNAAFKEGTKRAFEEMLEDPAAAAAKEELKEALAKLPEVEAIEDPKFQVVMSKVMDKLNNDPKYQAKMASEPEYTEEMALAEFRSGLEEAANELEEPELAAKPETDHDIKDVDKLLVQMRDLLKAMGGGGGLEAEIDAVLAEDPTALKEFDPDQGMDMGDLTAELIKMAKAADRDGFNPNADEPVPLDMQAKVDKIMSDPKLLDKLSHIQEVLGVAKAAQTDITNINHEVAPDPYELEDCRTATLKQRMQAARADPVHRAALDDLVVSLPRPFGVSPALKSFNQAIELAYVGANDDVRRVLWRSYSKARTLPTFLQNMSDDAWDILYYSQAVTWGANQNRQDHLHTILADLKKLGRDGPPTHPSTLPRRDDGEVKAEEDTGNEVMR